MLIEKIMEVATLFPLCRSMNVCSAPKSRSRRGGKKIGAEGAWLHCLHRWNRVCGGFDPVLMIN